MLTQTHTVYFNSKCDSLVDSGTFIGQSQAFHDLLRQAYRVAETNCRVLLVGESGTGKDRLAHIIHDRSHHRRQPLIKIDCARNASEFLDEESSYRRRDCAPGLSDGRNDQFKIQEIGTLFFDNIGALSPDHQTTLLRFLLRSRVHSQHKSPTLNTGCRVIASTRGDLRWAVATKKFRADLFYRLNVIPLRIPPLRDRLDDIPTLTNHFMKKHASKQGKTIVEVSENTLHLFMTYAWPGNIRELETVVERGVVLSQGSVLDIKKSALGLITSPSTMKEI